MPSTLVDVMEHECLLVRLNGNYNVERQIAGQVTLGTVLIGWPLMNERSHELTTIVVFVGDHSMLVVCRNYVSRVTPDVLCIKLWVD